MMDDRDRARAVLRQDDADGTAAAREDGIALNKRACDAADAFDVVVVVAAAASAVIAPSCRRARFSPNMLDRGI